MNKKESLSRKLSFGIFYLLSSSLASLGLNVVTVGFVARSLGVENFGLYSAIFSFVGLFQFLSDFGLNRTLLKFGSTDIAKAQVSFGNALFIKSILILPTIFLVTFFGLLSGFRGTQIIILEFFTISLIFDSYGAVFSSIRRILGDFKLISFFRVLKTAINLLIIFAALKISNSVLSLAFANMLLSLVIFVISLINSVLLMRPKLKLRLINDFFKDSGIFSLNDFFLDIYARISTVLLSILNDLHSVGIYSAALKFTRIANLIPNQVKFALLPTMYRIVEDERGKEAPKQRGRKVFSVLIKYLAIFSTLIVVLIYFFSSSIIHLIFGKKYDLSIPLVQLFSLFIYMRFLETPYTLFYIAMNKHKNMLYFQAITNFLNIFLNIILIPFYSAHGACIATLISEIFFALMLIIGGSKYLIWNMLDLFKVIFKPTASIVITVVLVVIFLGKANVFIQLLSLFSLYFIFLFLTKVFDKGDKELFFKVFAISEEKK